MSSNATKDIGELTGERYLQSGDVDARIAYLHTLPVAQVSAEADGEFADELAALEEFRDEVSGYAGAAHCWNNGMTLIADRAWNEFAEDEAETFFGQAAVESGYFELARFTRDYQDENYRDADLDCTTFWFRG